MFTVAASGSNVTSFYNVQRSMLNNVFRVKWTNTFVENPHTGVQQEECKLFLSALLDDTRLCCNLLMLVCIIHSLELLVFPSMCENLERINKNPRSSGTE